MAGYEGFALFGDFDQALAERAYNWVKSKKLTSFAYMALFYMHTQYELSYFPIGRKAMRHLGMMLNIQRDARAPSELLQVKNLYIQNNYTFQSEFSQDLKARLADEAWQYFSPVGRDNYLRMVEQWL